MAANGFESDGRNNLLDFFLGSLARAASSLFALIILITVVSSGYSLMTSEREKSLRDEMTAREAKNVQLLVKLTGLVKKIQIDVIQVQQFLSDYSATRGLDGHDDGLPSAENFAQQFTADAAAAKDAAREFNAPALIDVLTNMEGQFPAYYSQGVVMAKVYAAEGPGEGNKLMGAFDTVSDEMQEQLTRSDAALEESKAQWEKANALADEQLEMLRSNARFATLVSFMASVLACVLGIISVRIWIVAPIVRVADNFMRLARGSMDYDVIKSGRRDEIGDLIRTFNTFRTIVTEAEAGRIRARQQDELLASHQQLAETERQDAEQEKSRALCAMIEQVEHETKSAVRVVVDQIQDLSGITSKMSGTADRLGETSSFVTDLAGGALTTTRSALSSTQELSNSIDLVATRVRDAKSVSDDAVNVTLEASGNIEALSKSVTEIDEVTALIMNIARQTGLLALNAGVEAARAGDQGLGFAILAREVKSLSEKTFEATTRIGELISQVRTSTTGTVESVNNISAAIDRVSRASEEISQAIMDQVSTTRRIAKDVEETTSAIANVAQQIRHVDNEVVGARALAKQVDTVCTDISHDVSAMQKALVKIVRTSSAVVDRRATTRTSLHTVGTIEAGGVQVKVSIIDISEGGAQISGQLPPRLGTFRLRVSGIERPLPARVISMEAGIANVAFDIDEGAVREIRAFIERVTPSLGAGPGLRLSA